MEEEDTIELIDLLRVVWKWKWMIILVTVVCALVAGVISMTLPEVYRISAIIEPGTIGTNQDGELIYIDEPSNIQSRIEEGAFNLRILRSLGLNPKKEKGIPDLQASNPKGSKLVKIASEYEFARTDLGLKAMNRLLEELAGQYQELVDLKRKDIEKQIMLNKSEIEKKNNKIRLVRENITISKEEEKFLIQELRKVRSNTEIILKKRDALLGEKSDSYAISALLYANTIQQNMTYINQLNSQLLSVRRKNEELSTQIGDLQKDIEKIHTQIERLKLQEGFVQNIKQIQAPEVSINPVKPKKTLNVALAGIVGFFVSIFLAFFIEYLQKAKSYPEIPTTTTQGKRSARNKQQ